MQQSVDTEALIGHIVASMGLRLANAREGPLTGSSRGWNFCCNYCQFVKSVTLQAVPVALTLLYFTLILFLIPFNQLRHVHFYLLCQMSERQRSDDGLAAWVQRSSSLHSDTLFRIRRVVYQSPECIRGFGKVSMRILLLDPFSQKA